MSKLIKEGIDEDEDEIKEREFSIIKVESDILQKVIGFCTLYQKEPMKKIETPLIADQLETRLLKPSSIPLSMLAVKLLLRLSFDF